jgi:TonB family protein
VLKAIINKEISPTLTTQLNHNNLISENSPTMNQHQAQKLASIYFAISAALLLHILLLLALSYIPVINIEELPRTVPTVTIKTGSKASFASQQSQIESSNTAAANAYLATLEASSFKVQQAKNYKKNTQDNNATHKPQPSPLKLAEKPPTKNTQSQSQTSRAQKANQGMMNIFKQKKITGKTTQISTIEHKELSDYEISLISILSRAVLYDEFHRFMKAKNGNEINFEVTLILHPSGAIKNAIISRSSGILEIDKLAKQVAFKVSPYPIPPTKDMQNGFRYTIPLTQKASQKN